MKKLILFCIAMLMTFTAYSQETSIKTIEVFGGIVGNKLKTVPVDSLVATKAGGKVYDSLIVTLPYGDCPDFSKVKMDSTGIRYGEHIIGVRALNDSVAKNKADSVYVEISLQFETPDGKPTHSGLVLTKGWTTYGAATNAIDPANTTFKTYMMCQSYFKASIIIKAYAGYKKTASKVTVWKYYRPKR